MSKSLIDKIGRERANQLMQDAVAKAAAETDALGLPHVVEIDGVWCKQYPDGRIEPIDGEASHDPV
ncbi:hypothetical protein V1318_12870 [Lysobacter sp. CCNWLW3]|uniref:hypothetical protein n=1 Tax=unclassified Lysobacter TaxID=2635362 RepID=UPI002FD551E1